MRTLLLAFLYAIALALSTLPRLFAEDHVVDTRMGSVLTLFTVAAFAAALVVAPLVSRVTRRLSYPVRAGLVALVLAPATLALLMGFFAIEFWWNAYGDNDPLWTWRGLLQFGFTSAQGAFYFGVFGARLLWPWGLAPLCAAALTFPLLERRT